MHNSEGILQLNTCSPVTCTAVSNKLYAAINVTVPQLPTYVNRHPLQ